VWSYDPESYVGVSACYWYGLHTRRAKGDGTDKKGYPGPPGQGLGMRLTTPPHKKLLLQNLKEMKLDRYLGNNTKAIHKGLLLSCVVVTTKIIYWVLDF